MQGEGEGTNQALTTSRAMQPSAETFLWTLLRSTGPSSEGVSAMASDRNGYGMAWLCLSTTKKGKVQGEPYEFFDFSDCNLSPQKIFLMLDQLPKSVEGLKIGSSAVKGPALPLLRRFLEGVGGGGEGDKDKRPMLKKLSFADSSVGPSESEVIFAAWPSSLESFILKHNFVGTWGMRAFGEVIKHGKVSCLRVLDLQRTGLNDEGLKIFCKAVEGKSLKVETLNLSGNGLGVGGMENLCSALCAGCFSDIRHLLLGGCNLSDEAVERLADCMERGGLLNLEILDLEQNDPCSGRFLGPLGSALRKDAVPRMRTLKLKMTRVVIQAITEGVGVFLRSLSAAECPSDLHVHIRDLVLRRLYLAEDDFRALAAGKHRPLRTLSLHLDNENIGTFFGQLIGAPRSPPFESLDLFLTSLIRETDIDSSNGLRLLSQAIQMGRLNSVRMLSVCVVGHTEEVGGAGKAALFTSLGIVKLPILTDLQIWAVFTDSEVTLLAQAIRCGNLSGLRHFGLTGESLTGSRMQTMLQAVFDSETGMPVLEKLELRHTRAGEVGRFLGTALVSGKLGGKLSEIDLSDSYLTGETLRGLSEAVRDGALVNVLSLSLGRNGGVTGGMWGEFMRTIAESRGGLPKLEVLSLDGAAAQDAGGAIMLALLSGKVPSLRILGPLLLSVDAQGLGEMGDAVRAGRLNFPPRLSNLGFRLRDSTNPNINIDADPLITAIAESENGLPSSVRLLDLSGGRVGNRALASLAASGVGGAGGKLSYLQELILRSCDIDDGRLRAWGEVFSAHECPKLALINLSSNRISVEGVSAFLRSLSPQSLPELRSVRLEGQEGVEGEEQQKKFKSSVEALRSAAKREGKVWMWDR
uniref:Uncharacterized protein n=1 Tax=Chromera velia CCMP2878 TaxID=1169474 RepID=A0A0G4GD91_9ALVE|eukprot:Cvel_4546.t1-p1 / transcript=Cvel_4546.t1 / gene=Cvel_4546 / organism=Chromera_velia_CCMP2878 / gene_product=hypothetical protein / transcript_product=hypothetical protein / location=Cvel_scaffold199:59348-63563(+) / protein_length=863 / sequence_SO=supercontig / SO=protein_coding / is_pseudo=false